jgi:hypothetical protein
MPPERDKTDETNEPEGTAQKTPKARTDLAKLLQSLIDRTCTTGAGGQVTKNLNSTITNAELIRIAQFQHETVKEKAPDIVEMRWVDPPKKT